jgi:predicted DNA-binding protein
MVNPTGKRYDSELPRANISAESYAQLKALSERTRVPMAVYIREGVEVILNRYKNRGASHK